MNKEAVVSVFDIVGGPICVATEDGQKVFEKIKPLLSENYKVVLSFERVETLISTFLNAAIGQLYGSFSEEQLSLLLSVKDIKHEDIELLKRVVENAKSYYSNPQKYNQAWQEESGDDEQNN